MNLIDIMTDLAQPFAPQDIDFLPKSQFERDGKTMCAGLPFADKRVYEDRLNRVCPGEWSSQMNVIVAGSKIIAVATVTICGVPHTDVGEANMGENSATESAAQAFKRACSQVGLGRFLYALDKQYIPYDKQKKRFALNDQEMLAVVKAMYRKAGLLSSVPVATTAQEQSATARPAQTEKPAERVLVPTIGTTYKRGLVTKAWTEKDFYAAASAILGGIPVAKDTALSTEQLKRLAEAAEQGAVVMA